MKPYIPFKHRHGNQERALRTMEAANLVIGQVCIDILEGHDPSPIEGVGK